LSYNYSNSQSFVNETLFDNILKLTAENTENTESEKRGVHT